MCKHLSETLKKLRKASGMRQQDVADLLNVARVTYSNYERGAREPGKEILTQLSRIYHVSVDYLTGESDVPRAYQDYTDKEKYIFDNLPHINEPTLDYLVSVVEFARNQFPSVYSGSGASASKNPDRTDVPPEASGDAPRHPDTE